MCKGLGIAVTAYSSFGPMSYVEMGSTTADMSPFLKPEVIAIAERH